MSHKKRSWVWFKLCHFCIKAWPWHRGKFKIWLQKSHEFATQLIEPWP